MKRTFNYPITPAGLIAWLNSPNGKQNEEKSRIDRLLRKLRELQWFVDADNGDPWNLSPQEMQEFVRHWEPLVRKTGETPYMGDQIDRLHAEISNSMRCYRGHLTFHSYGPPLPDGRRGVTDDFSWNKKDFPGKRRLYERLAIQTLIAMARDRTLPRFALCELCGEKWILRRRPGYDRWCSVNCRKAFHRKNRTAVQRRAEREYQHNYYIKFRNPTTAGMEGLKRSKKKK